MVTIWHNPRCSKSRQALQLLQENGCDIEIYRYLEERPTESQLRTLLTQLNIRPSELVRRGEPVFKLLSAKEQNSDDQILQAMAADPILIERPIVIGPNGTVIGRPVDAILMVI